MRKHIKNVISHVVAILLLVLYFSAQAHENRPASLAADDSKLRNIKVPNRPKADCLFGPGIARTNLKNLSAFEWSIGKQRGILITANLISGAKECVVLSARQGSWRIVGSSPSRYSCFWANLRPHLKQGITNRSIIFKTQQDLIGDSGQFVASSVDVEYDRKSKDFCIFDLTEPKCVKR